MGGSAFSAILPAAAFPRIPPPVYKALKARLQPEIEKLYKFVAVPVEAPEKIDHGDLDFVVASPFQESYQEPSNNVNVPHEVVKNILSAEHTIPWPGNRTSNFAVPIKIGDWEALGHKKEEDERRLATEDRKIFYQVDIHVCNDKAEWDRIVFFHSYGDLGMMLGLISRNAGLALGAKGLKLPDPPHRPFDLSDSFADITKFLGLSMETWAAGFTSNEEVFEWAASTKYFIPKKLRTEGQGIHKVKPQRNMYADFVLWAAKRAGASGVTINSKTDEERREWQRQVIEEALIFFNKKEEYGALVRERLNRQHLKEVFTGSKVRDMAHLGEYWKGVKMLMDAVREEVGGEENIVPYVEREGEEGLKTLVLTIQKRLGIYASEDHPV